MNRALGCLLFVALLPALLGCRQEKGPTGFELPGVIFSKEQTEGVGFALQGRTGWVPTISQIEELEKELPRFLASSNHPDAGNIVGQLSHYRRQYLGYKDNGRSLIYVNAFCDSGRTRDESWRTTFVFVQDGGKCYFQATYDVESKRFIALTINGLA